MYQRGLLSIEPTRNVNANPIATAQQVVNARTAHPPFLFADELRQETLARDANCRQLFAIGIGLTELTPLYFRHTANTPTTLPQ